jgi:cysteinyl-tRNA synthetase
LRGRLKAAGSTARPEPHASDELPSFADFKRALADDLDTPKALAILFRLLDARDVDPLSKRRSAVAMGAVLGLDLRDATPHASANVARHAASQDGCALGEALELLQARDRARAARAWEQADELRRRILALGYLVEDAPTGSRLTAVRPG